MKTCTKCNILKPLDIFGKKANYTDGLQYWCKPCHQAYKKSYYNQNLYQAKQERLDWKKANKEQVASYESSFRSKRYQTDIVYRIVKNQRNRVKQLITNKPTSFTKSIGCGSDFLKAHIESQFKSGMAWNNYGNGEGFWNVDHIRPLASFDNLENIEQFKEAFNYKNLQPLWWRDNLLKSDKWSKNENIEPS